MSYAELDAHPKKFDLMRTAFTLHLAIQDGNELAKAREEVSGK
jgi:hypothetical protein